ncbi:MAG: hypothetical protein ACWGQW_01550 [bacterium]
MNISNLDKAEVLLALWKGSRMQGLSFLGFGGTAPTVEDCRKALEKSSYVDYFFGRIIKCNLSQDFLDLRLYDRDCGPGAGEMAILAHFTNPDQ